MLIYLDMYKIQTVMYLYLMVIFYFNYKSTQQNYKNTTIKIKKRIFKNKNYLKTLIKTIVVSQRYQNDLITKISLSF